MRLPSLTKQTTISLMVLLLISGCASQKATFQVKQDENFSGKLSRVLIIYYNQDTTATLGRNFTEDLSKRIADFLLTKNVTSAAACVDKDALDREAIIAAAANKFRPEQILYILQTGANQQWVGAPGNFHRITRNHLELDLADVKTHKNVWRADIKCSPPPTPEELARQVIDEFAASQLLPAGSR